MLADIDSNNRHLSILALFMQPHSDGGDLDTIQELEKRTGSTIYVTESGSQGGYGFPGPGHEVANLMALERYKGG
ncbi:hypothetical protein D3C71_1831380 [compost metagenome]